MTRREFLGILAAYAGAAALGAIGGATAKESGNWGESEDDEPPHQARAGEERIMFAEYITIDNETRKVELRELTEVMAENLSETATILATSVLGGKVEVWRDRVRSTMAVDTGAVLELKRRAVWRDEHAGLLS